MKFKTSNLLLFGAVGVVVAGVWYGWSAYQNAQATSSADTASSVGQGHNVTITPPGYDPAPAGYHWVANGLRPGQYTLQPDATTNPVKETVDALSALTGIGATTTITPDPRADKGVILESWAI